MKFKNLLSVNPLLADRVRLAIMSTLSVLNDEIEFTELLHKLDLTRGNLSSHLKKLEDGGLIQVSKQFVDRKPCTTIKCTRSGRKELQAYLEQLQNVVTAMKGKSGA